jgi:hypothetical protein
MQGVKLKCAMTNNPPMVTMPKHKSDKPYGMQGNKVNALKLLTKPVPISANLGNVKCR